MCLFGHQAGVGFTDAMPMPESTYSVLSNMKKRQDTISDLGPWRPKMRALQFRPCRNKLGIFVRGHTEAHLSGGGFSDGALVQRWRTYRTKAAQKPLLLDKIHSLLICGHLRGQFCPELPRLLRQNVEY